MVSRVPVRLQGKKRMLTLTEVDAYWKKGNSPADQICRSRLRPSGCRQQI